MATTRRLTLEEFLALPETEPASEYEDGEAVQKPMPTRAHTVIQRLLSFVFTLYLRTRPGAEAGPELRCIFGPSGAEEAKVPDFVYVSAARVRGTAGDEPLQGPPDLAVEILSPDDRMMRVMAKVEFYLKNGVRSVWVINPDARTVMVMSSLTESRTLREDDLLDGGDVLTEFSVPVREILPPLEDAPVQPEDEPAE